MPMPAGDSVLIEHGDVTLDLDKDDESGGHDDRDRRMHADTQRAMIGVGVDRVRVSHLRHGKQGEQDQAHQGDRRQSRQL